MKERLKDEEGWAGFILHPSSSLNHSLQRGLLGRDEPPHVSFEKQSIGQAAEGPEWRGPLEDVDHSRASGRLFEYVDVAQRTERASDHFVGELPGAVDFGDACAEPLFHAEVAALEADQVPELEVARQLARRDESFIRETRALDVRVETARGIEADVRRREDLRNDSGTAHRGCQFVIPSVSEESW